MITPFILYVMHYSLINVDPIPFHARAPTLDELGKPVGEESWWLLSTPGPNGSFHLIVRVEVLTLKVLFHLWEEVKVAGHKVGTVRRMWQNLLELQAL